MKRDDTLWKAILENIFDDFLRFFFVNADKEFDMAKGFQFLDKELEQVFPVDQVVAPKFVDKLVKVFTREGNEQWMLVHIEVQGYRDKHFPERMFTYFYRIYDTYRQPVTAVAILTDGDRSFRPVAFNYDYMGTGLNYRFNMYKVMDQDETALSLNPNPFAIIVLAVLLALKKRKVAENELFAGKLELAKNLLQRNIPAPKVRSLMSFLKYYVHLGNAENNTNFEMAIEAITANKKIMGIEEFLLDRAKKQGIEQGLEQGIEQGEEKKSYAVVKNLLAANKFTISEIANFTNVTEAFVKKVRRGLKK